MIFVDRKLYGKAHNWKIGQEQAWTNPGSYSFTVPDTGDYEVIVVSGGGGGAGGSYSMLLQKRYRNPIGGSGGGTSGSSMTIRLIKDDVVRVYVGTGGKGGSSAMGGGSKTAGKYGTASAFGDIAGIEGAPASSTGLGPGSPGDGHGNIGSSGEHGFGEPEITLQCAHGGIGYSYEGVTYGAGGDGGWFPDDAKSLVDGGKGGDGLVVVRLLAYA